MESLPLLQVRRGHLIRVIIRVAVRPVRRWHTVLGTVVRLAVEITVRLPSNALLRHLVRLRLVALPTRRVAQLRARKGVVEHGVGDQTTGEVRLVLVFIHLKRVATGSVELAVCLRIALELFGIERVDITTVVLVEVGHVVVEQDGGPHVLGDVEAQVAAVGGDVGAGVREGGLDFAVDGPAGVDGLVVGFEGSVDITAGHTLETIAVVVVGGVARAVGVIEAQFLDLKRVMRRDVSFDEGGEKRTCELAQ